MNGGLVLTNEVCKVCGAVYSPDEIVQKAFDNPCCRGSRAKWKGAKPDDQARESYLMKRGI